MNVDWSALARRHPVPAVVAVRARYEAPGSFALTPPLLADIARVRRDEAERLLAELVETGLLTRAESRRCGKCGFDLEGTGDRDTCPDCGVSFEDAEPVAEVRYELARPAPRDVRWVLVLHGMNTVGTWQEELSWLLARAYRHSVPVAIYKYGLIRPGVVSRARHRALVDKVVAKMRVLIGEAQSSGYGGIPDVIAHSFGSLLLAKALHSTPALRIGRLILLGSVVPPSFDWGPLVDAGKVEAVLNHSATADGWVPLAHYGIPDAGPGGIAGFGPPVTNVAAVGLGHSDYFTPPERMRMLFRDVWEPFLTWPEVPPLPGTFAAKPWKPARWRRSPFF